MRRIVAERALPEHAARLLDDNDRLVRLAAVGRAPLMPLASRLEDPEPEVRVKPPGTPAAKSPTPENSE
ncbi:MAG: hypothetical protein IPN78_13045 [Candidatus Accumulibacter sp.]|nr:hypothetical protein [Candidatus Accumulibacter propinquus]